MVLAVLLQNSGVFQAFRDRSTSGQPGARPPIDGKSFKKLEKLWKHNYFFDLYLKKLKKLRNHNYFNGFCQKNMEKLWKTLVLTFLFQNRCVLQTFSNCNTNSFIILILIVALSILRLILKLIKHLKAYS